ncbi:MAG: TIGR03936 family radical SAM-associated protein, partial [Lachnospiraceae bacterium]|nr:TIGR03936 family radical SAM-associated protein [Lachnospiraceae bacterium]
MKIRIKFTKEESVKYIGHLDIMRFFQRCFNRAGVKMAYSEGFNPHQKMSFAMPLGLGITSIGEYVDCEIADGQDLAVIAENMNKVAGDGFKILQIKKIKPNSSKAMASVKYAGYQVIFCDGVITPKLLNNTINILLA